MCKLFFFFRKKLPTAEALEAQVQQWDGVSVPPKCAASTFHTAKNKAAEGEEIRWVSLLPKRLQNISFVCSRTL